MPLKYLEKCFKNVGLINDGTNFMIDTAHTNSCLSHIQYLDKMSVSSMRYISWTLPCDVFITYTTLFLGYLMESDMVEYWDGRTYNLMGN